VIRSLPVRPASATLEGMKRASIIFLPALLGCCIIGTVAETAVDVATLPVKAVSAGVDAATTSQSEADQRRGRELRKQEEERGRQWRLAYERCRKGRPLPTDNCATLQNR
jgi:isocitrate lyase